MNNSGTAKATPDASELAPGSLARFTASSAEPGAKQELPHPDGGRSGNIQGWRIPWSKMSRTCLDGEIYMGLRIIHVVNPIINPITIPKITVKPQMIVVYGLGFSMTRGYTAYNITTPDRCKRGGWISPTVTGECSDVSGGSNGLGCWLAGSPAMFSLLQAPVPEFGRKPLFQVLGVNQAVALQF